MPAEQPLQRHELLVSILLVGEEVQARVDLSGLVDDAVGVVVAAPQDPDEAFPGVRFGASRPDLLRAYPAANCDPTGCTGDTRLYHLPASFFVFAQPDGRWVARLSVSDAADPGRSFRALDDGLSLRFPAMSATIEQGGNLYRWRDRDGHRQVVLRRCPSGCLGLAPDMVEVDYFEQGPATGRPW